MGNKARKAIIEKMLAEQKAIESQDAEERGKYRLAYQLKVEEALKNEGLPQPDGVELRCWVKGDVELNCRWDGGNRGYDLRATFKSDGTADINGGSFGSSDLERLAKIEEYLAKAAKVATIVIHYKDSEAAKLIAAYEMPEYKTYDVSTYELEQELREIEKSEERAAIGLVPGNKVDFYDAPAYETKWSKGTWRVAEVKRVSEKMVTVDYGFGDERKKLNWSNFAKLGTYTK
jgi:hypothetical protein